VTCPTCWTLTTPVARSPKLCDVEAEDAEADETIMQRIITGFSHARDAVGDTEWARPKAAGEALALEERAVGVPPSGRRPA
jgi:hypothetical protein